MNSFDVDVSENTEAGRSFVCPVHGQPVNHETGLECGACAREAMAEFYDRHAELTGLEEHLRDSLGAGDARRCPRHPHVKTSSDDGMFDAPCGLCETAVNDANEAWDVDPTNTTRTQCATIPWFPTTPGWGLEGRSCLDMSSDDDICF